MERAIAHVRQNSDGTWAEPHWLGEHLEGVAELASKFASDFGNADWGLVAGFWHDLGKFLPDWQVYLKRESKYDANAHIEDYQGRPNHSTVGAIHSLERFNKHPFKAFNKNPLGRIIAYLIAGHHAGLPDWSNTAGSITSRTIENPLDEPIDQRYYHKEMETIKAIPEAARFLEQQLPVSIPTGNREIMYKPEQLQLWVHMLYSSLVDADFLDTERYMDSLQHDVRGNYPSIVTLKSTFDEYMLLKANSAPENPVKKPRQEILAACRAAAVEIPGFFDLTVPTGGGKTLSSMAFALEHAKNHHKTRIIMAIPYTSIIEQTAMVYSEIFGDGVVLEHHSNLDPERETRQSRLASENWDAPIVVTTNVQLFESLLVAKSSSNRKLHNLTNSIIILDEAQMLPTDYYRPVLSVLQGLVDFFGATVLFCTATQPALEGIIGSGAVKGQTIKGIEGVRHIIKDPDTLARNFVRVQIEKPINEIPSSWESIADDLKRFDQVLTIVNTRNDARTLHALMPPGTIHLSANMCGEERSEIIAQVKGRLKAAEPIRVISTQLVEAGVDIDFPIVYRAMAGFDSIAQAAGRCNREGLLNATGCLGRVVIFYPPKPAPVGFLRKGEDATKTLFHQYEQIELSQKLYTAYFREFYSRLNGFDAPEFEGLLASFAREFKFQFRSFAGKVRIIDDTTHESIIVLYDGEKNSSFPLVEELRAYGPNQGLSRKLQRFVVNVPKPLFNALKAVGCFEDIHGYTVQAGPGMYRKGIGFIAEGKQFDPSAYVI